MAVDVGSTVAGFDHSSEPAYHAFPEAIENVGVVLNPEGVLGSSASPPIGPEEHDAMTNPSAWSLLLFQVV